MNECHRDASPMKTLAEPELNILGLPAFTEGVVDTWEEFFRQWGEDRDREQACGKEETLAMQQADVNVMLDSELSDRACEEEERIEMRRADLECKQMWADLEEEARLLQTD